MLDTIPLSPGPSWEVWGVHKRPVDVCAAERVYIVSCTQAGIAVG